MEEGEERSPMAYTEPQQQADEEKKCEDSSSGGRFPEMNDIKEETKEKDVELFSIEKSSEIDASNMEEGEEEKEKEQLSLNVQSYGIDDLEKIDGVSYFVSSSSTDASNVIVNDEEDFFPESFDGSVPSMVAVNAHAVASLVTYDTATAAALVEEAPSVVDNEVQLVSSPINADGVSSISVQEASMVPIDASDTPSPAVGPPIHEAFMVLTSLDASDIPSPAVAPPIHEASMVPTKLDASDTPSPAVAPPIHEDGAQSEVHMVPEEASITSHPTYTYDTTSISAPEVPRAYNEKISPSHADDAPLLPDQEASSPPKVVEEAPPVGSKGSPSMVAEDVSLLVNEEVPSMPAEVAHEVVDKSILKATEDSPPVVDKHEFPMVNQEVSPMVDDGEVSPNFDEDASLIDNSPMVDDGEVTPNFDGDASLMDNGNAFPTAADEVMHAPDVDTEMDMDTEIETEAVEVSRRGGAKRKRGRPARVQAKVPPARIEEEDVCFICFDGGNLVLCDRRGCPKAYHPACVNRDDAFFRAKGRWNCGWHICSNCQKAAQYMCYTCTYSLCKACIKEADFFRVRGNRGFCAACMGTITLIEKNDQADKELAQVDFNDKTSWEYLFKEYWVDLKRKLSITPDELAQAKNPFKGSNIVSHKGESSEELYDANDDKGSVSDDSFGHHEVSVSKRRKPKRRSKSSKEEKPPNVIPVVGQGISSTNTEWASKELLEFVAHMKNGDKSVLSQFDVQALLLDYIKQSNLRDPRRKSQIVCDSRLENLFGKARVGHFEMLKLLESHFLLKEDAHAGDNQEPANNEANQIDGDDVAGVSTKISLDKRRKSRKKGDNKGPQTNLDDYAAVDAHNIKLLYLRRNLMEELLEDTDKFHDKVVGSFVRIRIPGSGQKHDMYRVVKVIGTQKAAEPYKTSKRSADVVLEILNLDKTELITIDTISNQEFTEDECKRLRQSIKCGLISPMTVGELQEKALTLQSVRVNDWLEMEKLRISHLRDRASEQGRRKDLRECVEKLQLLNTPEERFRRLQEIPEVHSDPKMDPNYESEEHEEHDDSPQGKLLISRDAGFSRKRRDPISPRKESLALVDTWNVASKGTTASSDGRNMSTTGIRDRGYGASGAAESVNSDAHLVNSWEKPKNLSSAPILGNGTSSGIAVGRSEPPQDLGIPNLTDISSSINETEKMWHYKDPSGKVQGPFSMAQLRKWSTTGHFPADLRIWRISESSEDSILLNDALVGKFEKDLPKDVDGFVPPERAPSLLENNWGVSVGSSREGSTNTPWIDKTQIERGANSNWNNVGGFPNGGIQPLNSGVWNSTSSSWTAPTTNFMGEQSGHFIQGGWDPTRGGNAWSGQSTNIPHSYSRQPLGPTSHQGMSGGGRWRGQGEGVGGRWRGQGDSVGGRWSRGQVDPSRGRWNRGQTRGNNWNSNRYRGGPQFSSGRGYDRRANNMGPSGQFSGENMRAPFENRMNGWNSSNTGESPNMMTEGWGVNHCNKSSSDLPSPTPRSSNANRTDQASENKWSPTWSSTFQANPMSSAAPMMGSTGVQLSAVGIPNPNKTASGWIEQQNLSATPTGGRAPSSGPVPVPVPPTAAAPMRVDTINQDVRDYSGPPTPTPMPIGNCLQP